MQHIQVITFDVGGTLLFPHPSVGEVYAAAMSRYRLARTAAAVDAAFALAWENAQRLPRIPADPNWEKNWWREIVRQVVIRLDGDPASLDFDALFEELWVAFAQPERWRLYDAARQVLATLRQRGYRLAVLSNWDHRLRPLLDSIALSAAFDHLFISAELGVEKPHPAIFRCAEERFGLPPRSFLHVGDSRHHDVNGAANAGWQYLHIQHRHDAPPLPGTIGNLGEILDRLPLRPA